MDTCWMWTKLGFTAEITVVKFSYTQLLYYIIYSYCICVNNLSFKKHWEIVRKHFPLRSILRHWNFICKLPILKTYFLIMVIALCAYIFGNSYLCNFQTTTLFLMQMETCIHINAAMFLQIGQSCWWCMAGICNVHSDEHICDVETLDTGIGCQGCIQSSVHAKDQEKTCSINPPQLLIIVSNLVRSISS